MKTNNYRVTVHTQGCGAWSREFKYLDEAMEFVADMQDAHDMECTDITVRNMYNNVIWES